MGNINCEMRCELSHQNRGNSIITCCPKARHKFLRKRSNWQTNRKLISHWGEPAQHKPDSKIDISLDDDQPPKLQPDPVPGQILQTEMEMVNRHHEEVREQHRRARVQQEG